ncbi:MAG: ribosome recycling factor [Myxococcota bacterium]|nr:ribosome recycling factor [Myxococcota bacterium]
MNEYIGELKEEMAGPIRHLRTGLGKVRTGRASLALLDDIQVEYYGAPTPLNGVASLSVPEPRMIILKPWDPGMLGEIEKALSSSSLGITPNNDGKIIRLTFPELTGERRTELTRQVAEMGEQAKVGVRNVRRDYNELFKGMQKDGELSEDDCKRLLDQVQEETNQACNQVDEVVKNKEQEILEGA